VPADGDDRKTLYEVDSLALLASAAPVSGGGESPMGAMLTARFQAQPFTEPLTRHNYVRARWYDPETGTWLSPDPMGYRDSSNLYAFAGGDPVNGRDPRGEGDPRVRLPAQLDPSHGMLASSAPIRPALTKVTAICVSCVLKRLRDAIFEWEAQRQQSLRRRQIEDRIRAERFLANWFHLSPEEARDQLDFLETVGQVGNLMIGVGKVGPEVPISGELGLSAETEGVAAVPNSGLDVVPRPNMPVRRVQDPMGRIVTVWGQAEHASSKTPGHAEAINQTVDEMISSGEYEYITIQRSWRTATGRVGESARIPDIIGVRRTGEVDAIEIMSKTDTELGLQERLQKAMESVPESRRGFISVRPPLDGGGGW
ncbi:MAG: RHS repeat-associated core domain-containing protein, partial [Thermoanaerobaculia bacterium]